MDILDAVLAAQIAKNGSGGGGSVTPASIVTATGQMTAAQAAETRGNLGAEPEKFVITLEDGAQPDTFVADKTVEEIVEAFMAGKFMQVVYGSGIFYCVGVVGRGLTFVAQFINYAMQNVEFGTLYLDEDTGLWAADFRQFGAEKQSIMGATPTITPVPNTIYNCGTLTSLTITDPPATGSYVIKFTSGSTATTTTIPASIIFPEAFAAEANTRYEINVEDGYAVAVGWPVS